MSTFTVTRLDSQFNAVRRDTEPQTDTAASQTEAVVAYVGLPGPNLVSDGTSIGTLTESATPPFMLVANTLGNRVGKLSFATGGTRFLREDGTWQTAGGSSTSGAITAPYVWRTSNGGRGTFRDPGSGDISINGDTATAGVSNPFGFATGGLLQVRWAGGRRVYRFGDLSILNGSIDFTDFTFYSDYPVTRLFTEGTTPASGTAIELTYIPPAPTVFANGDNKFVGQNQFINDDPFEVAVKVRAATAQTADIQQWNDSASNTVARIGPNGRGEFFGLYARPTNTASSGLFVYGTGGFGPNEADYFRIFLNDATGNGWPDCELLISPEESVNLSHGNARLSLYDSTGVNLYFTDPATLTVGSNLTNNILQVTGGTGATVVARRLLASGATAAEVPVIARGAASQSANLTEWQNSAGTVLGEVSPTGRVSVYQTAYNTTEGFSLNRRSDGVAVMRMYMNSGTEVTVDSFAGLNYNGGGTVRYAGPTQFAGTLGRSGATSTLSFGTGNPFALFASGSATVTPLVARGAASQSANLQEWQDSAGTATAYMSSVGQMYVTEGVYARKTSGGAFSRVFFNDVADNMGWRHEGNGGGSAYYGCSHPLTTGSVFFQMKGDNVGQIKNSGSLVWNATASLGVGVVPFAVSGSAGHTANLTEWQNSAGGVLAYVSAAGVIAGQSFGWMTAAGGTVDTTATRHTNGGVTFTCTSNNARFTLVARDMTYTFTDGLGTGFTCPTTADFNAKVRVGQSSRLGFVQGVATNGEDSWFVRGASGGIVAQSSLTTQPQFAVQATAGQTADLQRWQNSGGVKLSGIDNEGYFTGSGSAGFTIDYTPTAGTNGATVLRPKGDTGIGFQIAAGTVREILMLTEDAREIARFSGQFRTTRLYKQLNLQAESGQTTNLQEWQNSAATVLSFIAANGAWSPASLADGSAALGTVYYSTTAAKLVYKDAGGVVNDLYGGGGSAVNSVAAVVNFGTRGDVARVTVTGQAWVTPSSVIVCQVVPNSEHNAEEVLIEQLFATVENVVNGVGFDVVVHAPNSAGGQFAVNCLAL